ncbi:aminoglycoside 3'-phosphotransferase [Paenibacillus sp. LjRoot56]|uniref:aminoglycoside 3'-phosphotransferase n=1 Tax=Paenibacillus sp. LjRoot56 TaxID=3342333 RepID=UPI003ECD28F5
MERREISFDIETVPNAIKQYIKNSNIYDSSCSENAKTLFVKGLDNSFLKISKKGSLEREFRMTSFLHSHNVAPKVMAFESDQDNDYFLTEAITGEDGVSGVHLKYPNKLATVLGENLRMLHSISTVNCPYDNRTSELLDEQSEISYDLKKLITFTAKNNVIIHGDYCLPNIIMDNFSFKGFIDLGYGGVGDRHYDICWGIWTLNHNFKTNIYRDLFLDAYGREDMDIERLTYFTQLIG